MMGKLGLVPCQNYILQYRESKNDPTDDALKPIAELTDGNLFLTCLSGLFVLLTSR